MYDEYVEEGKFITKVSLICPFISFVTLDPCLGRDRLARHKGDYGCNDASKLQALRQYPSVERKMLRRGGASDIQLSD